MENNQNKKKESIVIESILKEHCGKDNAIKSKDISKLLGKNGEEATFSSTRRKVHRVAREKSFL